MATKLSAARLAARSGTGTVIANGRVPGVVASIAAGESVGTFLQTQRQPQSARKQWLASLLHAKGQLVLDDGAVRGVSEQGRSLLPIGITAVSGEFQRGDLVSCVDSAGRERARTGELHRRGGGGGPIGKVWTRLRPPWAIAATKK